MEPDLAVKDAAPARAKDPAVAAKIAKAGAARAKAMARARVRARARARARARVRVKASAAAAGAAKAPKKPGAGQPMNHRLARAHLNPPGLPHGKVWGRHFQPAYNGSRHEP